MSFNIQKWKFLRITNKINPIHFQSILNNEVICKVTHSKYLGVIIDPKLSWSQHIREVTNKARTKAKLESKGKRNEAQITTDRLEEKIQSDKGSKGGVIFNDANELSIFTLPLLIYCAYTKSSQR